MIVVDASAYLEVLLRTPAASVVEERIFAQGETLHAPHLIDLEIAQVLRRYVRTGEIDAVRGEEALHDFTNFPITRYAHHPFLIRIWTLRGNATACDAAYLALAEVLAAPLLTRDLHLTSIPGHTPSIINV